jgi:hypothetical protein
VHYASFEEYCQIRWGFSAGRARQLISGAQTAAQLETATGIKLPTEAVARELRKLPEAERPAVAIAAAAVAAAAGRDEMTTSDIKAVATPPAPPPSKDDAIRRQVLANGYSLIVQWMNQKVLTPKKALEVCDALNGCKPKVRGDMLRLQVVNTTIIRELNQRFDSDSYREIVVTGALQFADGRCVRISEAQPADLRDFFDERQREHLARLRAERDAEKGVKEVLLTLYLNNTEKSANMLRAMLGDKQAYALAQRVMRDAQKKRGRVSQRRGMSPV